MNKIIITGALCLFNLLAVAQKVAYKVSFPNVVHHEAQIALEVSDFSQKELIARMSRSSPGRYATHEYGKNVYDVKAFDKSGKPVAITRLDGDVYKVSNLTGYVKIQYTLYANHPDGTYAGIDDTSIMLNAPATFMWVKGLEKAPIDVQFNLPTAKKWKIATQLKPGATANEFSAPDLQYLMDSPIKIGDLNIKKWTLAGKDKKDYNFDLALETEGSDSLANIFAKKIERITQETQPIFGELPAFDYGKYTFIASFNPYVKGDGMEHRNSTVISRAGNFDAGDNLLNVFAHEFFHAWNVERIRPQSLEPFNYEKSNMSHELWFAEGFTQYYGGLILKRAGFNSLPSFCQMVSSLVNTKENTAGAKRVSPAQASNQAIFVDAGVAVDKTNYVNIYTSYYPYGAAIALALDLELRARKLSLDDYMAAVWLKYGKTEKPYVIADLEKVLAELTKDEKFATSFFKNYVNGTKSLDYGPLVQKAGMTLAKEFPGQAWLGDYQYENGKSLRILSNTRFDTPLYKAGLDVDDHIVGIDGQSVTSKSDLDKILASHKPGDQINIEYSHRGVSKPGVLVLEENPRLVVKTNEELGLPVTEEMKKFRSGWLDSKIQ
ncbi:M61 family metallopeptidase [Dyadobacter sp. CY312]|uniref:M61 family metallopeptidase n=1 Tax=Dyadobacter sp. CY312 TaxID=2907303 RepID=UPI001F181ED3|nr:PDZ domain-containing protein [Dyadobacter sp. CY312]MCE7039435.1 PDZ domain-containing protein [Dyadobacter sp. CY312]